MCSPAWIPRSTRCPAATIVAAQRIARAGSVEGGLDLAGSPREQPAAEAVDVAAHLRLEGAAPALPGADARS